MSITNQLDKIGAVYHGVTITNCHIGAADRNGIMVYHDYNGLYPDRAAMEKHNAVMNIARRNGLQAEQRGHYTATLIYMDGPVII